MKKIFFYASLLAFATSCTDEFDSLDAQNDGTAGISFKSEIVESRMMWNETEASYEPFWYAEIDRINVYGAGALSVGDPTGTQTAMGTANKFSSIATTPSVYKATQSKKNGVFTSLDITKTLNYASSKEAVFFATYPTTVTAAWDGTAKKIALTNALPASVQTQDGVKGDNKAQVMYAATRGNRINSYDAVGETVDLSFVRPLKALVFSTKNVNEYTAGNESIFGLLDSIKVTTKGYDKVATDGALDVTKGDILPTALSYTKASFLVDTLTNVATITKAQDGTNVNSIKLNIGTAWNDDALAIASIIPNERKAFVNADEAWEILFYFKNITLTHKFNAIPKGTKFVNYMPVPALDIQAYEYLVTNGDAQGKKRTLIVNSGKFANVFDANGNVKWNAETIDASNFEKIIVDSDVEMGDAAFTLLQGFNCATHLTLKGVTELKAGALTGLKALTYVNLPLVTTVASGAFYTSHTLAEVHMPAYDFSISKSTTNEILKAQSLTTLDMSGVKSMKAVFPNEGFTLDGFTKLKNVTVKEGLVVGASAFKGCTALESIANAVSLEGASAFEESALKTIKLTNTVIPVNAFKDATKLESVKNASGKTLYPTEIKNGAFAGAIKLEYLDLSKTTYVGEKAFDGAISYKGAYKDPVKKLNILYVNATEVGESAFNNTALAYVEFTNLTVLKTGLLTNITDLKEVKFKQVLATPTASARISSPFGTVSTVTLFLNENQGTKFYDGNDFYPNGDFGATYTPVKVSFNKITFE